MTNDNDTPVPRYDNKNLQPYKKDKQQSL